VGGRSAQTSLQRMFANVVEKYDLLNHLLTWGLDELWRKSCAKECASSGIILDLCCGTGDLTLHISEHTSPGTQVLGLDFSRVMLNKAVNKKTSQIKSKKAKIGADAYNISFIHADAAHLPFKNECIDRIGISFSFRNLVYRNPIAKACVREVLRVLRPGGKFVCIETSQPRWFPLRTLYQLYLRKVVPLVGGLMSGCKNAYRHLGMSAANFPPAEEIAEMLLSAGFREASFKHMAFGVVAMHICVK